MYVLIAVVAIVIVGAVAAIVLLNDDDDKEEAGYDLGSFDGRLTVFGNVNYDDYIDDKDMEELKSIVAGDSEAKYFTAYRTYGKAGVPVTYADVNNDGKIDNDDITALQNLLDKKEGTVWFLDVDNVVASCHYPLGTYAVGYKSNYEAMLIIGNVENCKYVCNQVGDDGSYAKWYKPFLDQNPTCFGSRFTPDYEVFADNPPDFMLSGTRAWFDKNMESTVSTLGMDVVRLPFWEDNWAIPAIITLGFLCDKTEAAYSYMEKADAVYKTINDTLKDVAVEDRPLVFAGYNGTSISTMHNGIHELVKFAGGKTPYDVGYSNGSIDAEAVYTMNPDYIVLDQYFGFLETYTTNAETKEKIVEQLTKTDNKYVQAIDHTNAYKDGKVYFFQQGDYMGPSSYIACAYLANHIWSDKFNFDVDAMFNDYVSSYHNDYKASDFAGLEYFDLETLNKYVSGTA